MPAFAVDATERQSIGSNGSVLTSAPEDHGNVAGVNGLDFTASNGCRNTVDDAKSTLSHSAPSAPPECNGRSATLRVNELELVSVPPKDREWIGVDGMWYDVTHFISKHPGGDIIKQFVGKDGTSAFKAFGHPPEVLQRRRAVARYSRQVDPVTARFEGLVEQFRRDGYYQTDWRFYAERLCLSFTFMAAAFYMVGWCESVLLHLLAPVVLMTAGQQFGYMMHETMHKQLVRAGTRYHPLGAIVGTAFTGFSSLWWQKEHNEHHAATNMVDFDNSFVDPQMYEECWVQDRLLFPFFTPPKSRFQRLLISVQHATYIPFVLFLSRFQIIFDSLRGERSWWEWAAFLFFCTWVTYWFYLIPTWPERLICGFIFNANGGFVHFLFTLSHYCRKFHDGRDFHSMSWYQAQIESNMNLTISPLMVWWYGGLNCHIEHHLFPTMARNCLAKANVEVIKVCQEFGIDYQQVTLYEAFRKTVEHFRAVAVEYDAKLKSLDSKEK